MRNPPKNIELSPQKQRPQLLDAEWRALLMKHCVTVRAHGLQVLNRVDFNVTFRFGERHFVVNFDEALPDFSISLLEPKPTDLTLGSVMLQARPSSRLTSLVSVDLNGCG